MVTTLLLPLGYRIDLLRTARTLVFGLVLLSVYKISVDCWEASAAGNRCKGFRFTIKQGIGAWLTLGILILWTSRKHFKAVFTEILKLLTTVLLLLETNRFNIVPLYSVS